MPNPAFVSAAGTAIGPMLAIARIETRWSFLHLHLLQEIYVDPQRFHGVDPSPVAGHLVHQDFVTLEQEPASFSLFDHHRAAADV